MNMLKSTSNFLHKVAFIIDSDVNVEGMNQFNEPEIGCHNMPIEHLKKIQENWVRDGLIR